jgi:flavin reductase (DIM6/NTAB) family NADH-FMN oxidoreductase RutF
MKRTAVVIASILFLVSCNQNRQAPTTEKDTTNTQETNQIDVKTMRFDQLFKTIPADEFSDNIFTLIGKDFAALTAGTESHYNGMAVGWGGIGILFGKPTTWCFLRANRYTLELMKKEQRYTLSFFTDEYKKDVLFLGSKTGRNTDKMNESALTTALTPAGNIAYKEARLIIECKMTELTTVTPDDFYTDESRKFITEAYTEAKDYHKLVFGEITYIWIRK